MSSLSAEVIEDTIQVLTEEKRRTEQLLHVIDTVLQLINDYKAKKEATT
jgi:hypothetical protein